MRVAAIYTLEQELPQFIIDSGLLTDELESNQTGASPGVLEQGSLSASGSIDERILPALKYGQNGTVTDQDYNGLQRVRGAISQAVAALATYDTGATTQGNPKVLRGELYALEGYTEILLADLFCSGVPLSTLDFQKDFTYHASSTTVQVYQDALVKEDSALALADTSTQILYLARVLQGRAQLALGAYTAAADDVMSVPQGFQYQLALTFAASGNTGGNMINASANVSNREGGTGLPFFTSDDPRARDTITIPADTSNEIFQPLGVPVKYSAGLSGAGYVSYTVADWIEADLIQAEAALHGVPTSHGSWLNQLNTLRATAPIPGMTEPQPDLLPPLTDPGAMLSGLAADSVRVSLLFQERAYWLYLTGHRQGDLRRLIREYGRRQDLVYPTGPYHAPGGEYYGSDVNAPIASNEYNNPLFHGCLNRDA